MKIYKATVVDELGKFYGELLEQIEEFGSIAEHLSALSTRMWEGVKQGNKWVFAEISNYHPQHLGKQIDVLKNIELTEEDCKFTVAREYGYRRWSEVLHQNLKYNADFEHTITAMLNGKFNEVKEHIAKNPSLINQKSLYGHKATLLHYAVSNGFEIWRQIVPQNLPEIVVYLIENGANTRAKMKVYGGEYMASELLQSSAHPKEAGIMKELIGAFNT
jgi:hypothetical protein